MEELKEFYSTIKLASGEEIIAKVCTLPDEDSILIDHPRIVETVKGRNQQEAFILKDWIKSSYDEMYVIKMDQVITMSELDKKIEVFYLKNLNKEDFIDPDTTNVKPKQFSNRMGYLGSVKETKKYLEDLFNKS
jgi:hypothetical protein